MPHPSTSLRTSSLVLRNARIYTHDRSQPWADAIAIEGDRIVWVGNEEDAHDWLGPDTREIDLGCRLVLPGLIDSHFHLLMGAKLLHGAQLDDALTVDALQQAVRAYANSHADQAWVTGRGWQYKAFPRGTPIHRKLLDAIVPDRPVYLNAFDVHTGWANTKALELAGILHGPKQQPSFGAVVIDSDGTATGELREPPAMDFVRNLIPALSNDERDALLRDALKQVASYGITSVHNMDGDADTLQVFRDFEARGEMTVREYVPLRLNANSTVEEIEEWMRLTRDSSLVIAHESRVTSPAAFVRTGGIKLFADGVVESKTAWMIEPYADGSGDKGVPNFRSDDFSRLIANADALKMQVAVHAIGDMAVRATLDAYQQARLMNGPRDARHRVEHIEVLSPQDLTRFGRMHVLASMQPLHADFGADTANPWRDLVGPGRWGWGFPWRALKMADVPIAFGSDWPVVTMNPFEGMRAGLSRLKLDFSDERSSFPDHRLTLAELIDGYTVDGAYFEFQENEKGQLRAGMLADVVALDQDLFALSKDELSQHIGKTRSALTVVGGRVVHEALG